MIRQRYPRLVALGLTLALLVALLAFFARAASAQDFDVPQDSTIRLTLGDAMRLAAQLNPPVGSARSRVRRGAGARDAASRRPAAERARRRSSSGAARSTARRCSRSTSRRAGSAAAARSAGHAPRSAQRARRAREACASRCYDPARSRRVRGRADDGAGRERRRRRTRPTSRRTAAANAYLAVLRADAVYSARLADSTLAAELLAIAQDQLRAGTGVGLDVTRARSQLTGARTQLIVARNERDRTRVELARAHRPAARQSRARRLARRRCRSTRTRRSRRRSTRRFTIARICRRSDCRRRRRSSRPRAIRSERLPTVDCLADPGAGQRNGRSYLPTYDWGAAVLAPDLRRLPSRRARAKSRLAVARDLEIRERDLRIQVEADVRIALLNLASSAEAVAAARERLQLAEQEVRRRASGSRPVCPATPTSSPRRSR